MCKFACGCKNENGRSTNLHFFTCLDDLLDQRQKISCCLACTRLCETKNIPPFQNGWDGLCLNWSGCAKLQPFQTLENSCTKTKLGKPVYRHFHRCGMVSVHPV